MIKFVLSFYLFSQSMLLLAFRICFVLFCFASVLSISLSLGY